MATRPTFKVSITQKDLGWGHFLKEAAKIKKKPFVKIGITQAKGSKLHVIENSDGSKTQVKTVADIAQIHEFGAPSRGIPERSFIRSTTSKNEARYNRHKEELRAQIFDASSGMTTEKALMVLGQEVSRDIKNAIRQGIGPALKLKTILRKNKKQVADAQAKVNRLSAKAKLTKTDKENLFKAQETVDTGGKSTPLIDKGQLINSISYEVDMNDKGESDFAGRVNV